jgi:glycosyltransferase involved in cell wall biosynthesis
MLRAVKRRLAAIVGPDARTSEDGPLVSIVIPVYNVENYLAECIESVLDQTYRRLQVVVINDGSTDSSAKIAARYARLDDRIDFHQQANAGLGATRNAGVKLAQGDYLYFLDSDDRLPKGALKAMVAAAQERDADIVMGPLGRFNSSRSWVPRWAVELHAEYGFFTSLSERPALLRNLYACAKLYRRSFWDAQQATFREGVAYEDQPVVTRLMVAARNIVALPGPVYSWRLREDSSSISQQTHTLADLVARTQAWDATVAYLIDGEGVSDELRSAWLGTVYGTHLHWYLSSDTIEDRLYWRTLHEAVVRLAAAGPSSTVLPPDRAYALELLSEDRHSEYLRMRRLGAFEPQRQRLRVQGAELVWEPELSDPAVSLQRGVACAATGFTTRLTRASWLTNEGELTVAGEHYLPGLDMDGLAVTHHLRVITATGDHVVEVPTDIDPAPPQALVERGLRAGSFSARIPAEAFGEGAQVRCEIRSSYGSLTRTDALPAPTKWQSASRLAAGVCDGVLVTPAVTAHRFELHLSPLPVWLASAEVSEAGLAVRVEPAAEVLGVSLGSAGVMVAAEAGLVRFDPATVDASAEAHPNGRVSLMVSVADGSLVPLVGGGLDLGPIRGRRQLTTDAQGKVHLITHEAFAEVAELQLEGDQLRVTLTCYARPGLRVKALDFASRQTATKATLAKDGSWRVALSDLPVGGYYLTAEFAGRGMSRRVRVAATGRYLASIPTTIDVGALRWRTLVAADGAVHVDCRAVAAARPGR